MKNYFKKYLFTFAGVIVKIKVVYFLRHRIWRFYLASRTVATSDKLTDL